MKLPLGITLTLTLLLLLQSLQQVSTQIPGWERENYATSENDNGEMTSKEVINTEPTGENGLGNVNTQVTPQYNESSSENKGQPYGSFYIRNIQQDQNTAVTTPMPPATDVLPNNETEKGSSESLATTTPPQMAEHNETETQETTPNTVTYPDPKPESTTGDSSLYETGSGYFPSEVPTENPTTTTEAHEDQENMQNTTTVKPSEPPAEQYRTTTPVTPPAIPEMETTAVPDIENTETDVNGSFDSRGDLVKGFSSNGVQDRKKNQAWGVILVIGIIVGVIALTAFLILNRRNRRDFSHRKLVEDISPDPVLRLDNSEPLDFGYYNPGMQRDNIQMTNFPQGRSN